MFDCFLVFRFKLGELLIGRDVVVDQILAVSAQAVKVVFPLKTLLGFVAFLRTGRGVTLRLGCVYDVD